MKIYWINSKNRQDRYKNMVSRLADVENERFEAIKGGSEISSRLIKEDGLFIPEIKRKNLNNAEIGCYLSHREIWKIIKANKIKKALILEDDAEFTKDAYYKACSVKVDYDMLYLGQRNYDNQKNAREKTGETASLIHWIENDLFEATRCWLTHAYVVDLKCVDYLLSKAKSLDWPIDGILADIQMDLKVLAFYPNLINQDKTKSSIR